MSGLLAILGAGGSSIQDVLENSSGFGWFQDFFRTWLKLDITTLAAILTIFGMISGAIRDLQGVAVKIYWWITKFFTASISIASNDRLNKEVLNWLGAQILTRQATRILTASSEEVEKDAWHYRRSTRERNDFNMEKRVPIQYLPTFGTTWFVFDSRIFIVRRISTSYTSTSLMGSVPDEYAAAPEGDEPLVVMCLGRSVKPIKNFLETCRIFADQQSESYVTVRTCKSQYDRGSWDTTILRPLRPLETVHFDEQTKTDLVTDISRYLDPVTRKFYNMRGIPYRRGYLLHGPAGTGKTSLSLALAGHFGLDLHLLHIPSVREDYELEALFAVLPPRCFILLEDIDAVGIKRRVEATEDSDDEDDDDKSQMAYRSRCTLSGLLNVLDGVASQEGRIVLMTSNFADKLDKALVRPGRIDQMIYLGFISPRSAELMFLRMFSPESDHAITAGSVVELPPGELEKLALQFCNQIPDNTFTPAQLQGYLLHHRGSPSAAIEKVSVWAKEEIEQMEAAKQKAKEIAAAKKRRKAKYKLAALQGIAAAEARLNEVAKQEKDKPNQQADSKEEPSAETNEDQQSAKEDPSANDDEASIVVESAT